MANVRYIKLYAHKYGNNANDHAVYGGIRLVKTDYDVDGELYAAIQPLSYYDDILSQNSIEHNIKNSICFCGIEKPLIVKLRVDIDFFARLGI